MKIGLGICLVVTWALVVAALLGPQASISAVCALWIAGLVLALIVSEGWQLFRATFPHEAAPWQDNGGYFVAGALLYVIGAVCMAWDWLAASWLGERLTYWRARTYEWWHRRDELHGDQVTERAKRLRF